MRKILKIRINTDISTWMYKLNLEQFQINIEYEEGQKLEQKVRESVGRLSML